MFRALCAHHQEVKIVLYSIWYRHTCRWPSGAQVGIVVLSQPVSGDDFNGGSDSPPHFHRHVREFLNQHLPQQWIGRGTDDDQMLLA